MDPLAVVDRDYIYDPNDPDDRNQVGSTWTFRQVLDHYSSNVDEDVFADEKRRFRLLDDDGEVYYGGWLYDDSECIMQSMVLEWGMWFAGCTTIEVKGANDEWIQEIG